MPAQWRLAIDVGGPDVVSARASVDTRVERRTAVPSPAGAALRALPTTLDDRLSDRDYLSMALLWLHSVSALGWIVGVPAMVLALLSRPAVLTQDVRRRIRAAYVRWGAWVHWGLAVVVVATGVYKLLSVSPFTLKWSPGGIRTLADEPYGALYEAILVVKLGLFVALLVTGTQVLLRTLRMRPDGDGAPTVGFGRSVARALGGPGLLYVAAVPLIIAAAMALRYVDVLNHVARVVEGG